MSKVVIPAASVMAKIAREKQQVFEKTVLESDHFRSLVQDIENKAIEGKTSFTAYFGNEISSKAIPVIRKYLLDAGYACTYEVYNTLYISWDPEENTEGR